MDPAAALSWLDAIALGAAGVWVASAWFVARTASVLDQPERGELEAAAGAAAVLAHAARQIATATGGSPLQSSIVDSVTAHEMRWHSNGPLRHHGALTVDGDSRRARVRWEVGGRSGLVRAGQILVLVGAVVTVVLYWALRTHVTTSADEGVRAQVLQMGQAIHLLWPPFLLAGLARTTRRRIADEVCRVVQNTPFA